MILNFERINQLYPAINRCLRNFYRFEKDKQLLFMMMSCINTPEITKNSTKGQLQVELSLFIAKTAKKNVLANFFFLSLVLLIMPNHTPK